MSGPGDTTVILSEAKDLLLIGQQQILRSLRSLRMTTNYFTDS
jgi:hypothetical protein